MGTLQQQEQEHKISQTKPAENQTCTFVYFRAFWRHRPYMGPQNVYFRAFQILVCGMLCCQICILLLLTSGAFVGHARLQVPRQAISGRKLEVCAEPHLTGRRDLDVSPQTHGGRAVGSPWGWTKLRGQRSPEVKGEQQGQPEFARLYQPGRNRRLD